MYLLFTNPIRLRPTPLSINHKTNKNTTNTVPIPCAHTYIPPPKTNRRQALDKRSTMELQAFVYDAYGLYFLRRGKSSAALDYVQKAMKTHARMRVRSKVGLLAGNGSGARELLPQSLGTSSYNTIHRCRLLPFRLPAEQLASGLGASALALILSTSVALNTQKLCRCLPPNDFTVTTLSKLCCLYCSED